MDTTTLDAILGGDTPAVAPSPQEAAQQTESKPQTDKGGPEKVTQEAETPAAEKPKAEKSEADKAFATIRRELKSERMKREALEREMTALRQPQQVIDPIADPEGFSKSFDEKLYNAVSETRFAVLEEAAADKYEDYEEMRDLFIEQARENPALRAEMNRARNPAEFAYKAAKEFKARQEIGDPVQYAEKIRQETIAKTMTDLDKIVEEKVRARLAGVLPTSLAETQSQGGRVSNPDGFNGPTPLNEILKKR